MYKVLIHRLRGFDKRPEHSCPLSLCERVFEISLPAAFTAALLNNQAIPWLVKLRLAANLWRVCINQLQKGAKDDGRVRFFPCSDKLDPDIIWLQTVEPD